MREAATSNRSIVFAVEKRAMTATVSEARSPSTAAATSASGASEAASAWQPSTLTAGGEHRGELRVAEADDGGHNGGDDEGEPEAVARLLRHGADQRVDAGAKDDADAAKRRLGQGQAQPARSEE